MDIISLFNIVEGLYILDGLGRIINLLAFLKLSTLFYLLNRLQEVFTSANSNFVLNIIELIRLIFKVLIAGHVINYIKFLL